MGFQFSPCPLPQLSRVWAYLRDSGGDTQDLSSQRAYLLAYCDHFSLRLERVFEDGAISGGSTTGRNEFELMIELARQNPKPVVDGILYWDTKRFARNQLDSQFYKGDLRRRGYRLISLSDDIPDNEFAVVVEAFLEWKAQKDRQDIAKDVKRGMVYIVSMRDEDGNYLGLFPGTAPTFFKGIPFDTGLKRNDGKSRIVQRLVPDPETWDKGKRMWQMRAERASYKEIERELRLFPDNANPSGTYSHIFRNEIYIGRMHYGGHIYEDFVPALATMEQWEVVQSLLFKRPVRGQRHPKDKPHQKAGRGQHLLSGLCQCLYCQASVHASVVRRKERKTDWSFYLCARKKARPDECPGKRIPGRRFEMAISEAIMSKVLTTEFVGDLAERVNHYLANHDHVEQKIEIAQKRLTKLEKAVANLLDMAELHLSVDVIKRLNEREAERDTIQREIDQLYRQLKQTNVRVDEELIVRELTEMRNTLSSGELKARKLMLKRVVDKIEVGRDVARLHYKFPLYNLLLERVRGVVSKVRQDDLMLVEL